MVFLPTSVVVSAKWRETDTAWTHQAGDVSTLKVVLEILEGDTCCSRQTEEPSDLASEMRWSDSRFA